MRKNIIYYFPYVPENSYFYLPSFVPGKTNIYSVSLDPC